MPELPDVELYVGALRDRILARPLERLRVGNPFVIRTIEPSPARLAGRTVRDVRRMGKRIVLALDGELFIVLHLMIAGRLRWREPHAPIPGKVGLAAFDFPSGTAILTEAGSRRQASIHLLQGAAAVNAMDPGGLEIAGATLDDFASRLRTENHTLKRALTDPHIFSGIGNAYSDEILHAARMSPMKLTSALSDEEVRRHQLRPSAETQLARAERALAWRLHERGRVDGAGRSYGGRAREPRRQGRTRRRAASQAAAADR